MGSYFEPESPTHEWFNGLERVVQGLGGSYVERSAAHLDLVQEATDPTWSVLKSRHTEEASALLNADLPFLLWQIDAFSLEVVACNGRTVFDTLSQALDAKILEKGQLARLTWWVAQADVAGRTVVLVSWNLPLARPTGLGAQGEVELGHLLGERSRALGVREENAGVVRSTDSSGRVGSEFSSEFGPLVGGRRQFIRDFLL
jgi:hypothetical protein